MLISDQLGPFSDFEFRISDSIFRNLDKRDAAGVYSIAISNFYEPLSKLGFEAEPGMPEVWTGEYFHAYVGETYSLKARLRDHLLGEAGEIGFRQSASLVLGLNGTKLNTFLIENSIVACRMVPFMGDVEAELIRTTACPLNLRGKGQSPFAKRLRALRKGQVHP
jgi:hypothetical protein